MELGFPELLLVLFIVGLLFGPGRIAGLGKELGASLRAFREGISHEELNPEREPAEDPQQDMPDR